MRNAIHKKIAGFRAVLLAAVLLLSTMIPQLAVQAAPKDRKSVV